MAKIPIHDVTDMLVEQGYYDDSWWDWQNEIDNMINEADSEYSWQWRMEVSIRKNEGWFLYTAPEDANTLEIFTWLDENGVRFKSESDQFLISEEQWYISTLLTWG